MLVDFLWATLKDYKHWQLISVQRQLYVLLAMVAYLAQEERSTEQT